MEQKNIPVPEMQNKQMPITDAEKYIKQKYGNIIKITIAILAVLEILLFYFMIYFRQTSRMIIDLSILPIVLFGAAYGIIRKKAEDAFFQQFASTNGFAFQKMGLPDNLYGSLFFVGRNQTGYDLVSGTFQKTPFVLFNYQYIIGEGKSSHVCVYTIFRLDFLSSLPPIFLKPKYCEFGGFVFGDISKDAREKLELEGDFDKYFDLWTKQGFEVEALQVFTPDFMQKIEDNWKQFSLEFVNSQIYIYSDHMITRDDELENMYQLIQYLIPKIVPFAKEVKGDIAGLNEYYKK